MTSMLSACMCHNSERCIQFEIFGKIPDLPFDGVSVIGKIHQHIRHKLLVSYSLLVNTLYKNCKIISF